MRKLLFALVALIGLSGHASAACPLGLTCAVPSKAANDDVGDGSTLRARSLQTNDRDVNILEFGADPTGTKDSTAAIQAAIDYVFTHNGAGQARPSSSALNAVFCSAGSYKTSYPIFFDPPGNMRGGSIWNNMRTYKIFDLVIENGAYYYSLKNENEGDAPSSSPGDWQTTGQWSPTKSYAPNFVVVYDGMPWQSLTGGNIRHRPSTGLGAQQYWAPIVSSIASFSYGASWHGVPGLSSGNGCTIKATFNNAPIFWAPPGNGDEIDYLLVQAPTVSGGAGHHCGLPPTGAGISIPGDGGGANRTKLVGDGAENLYYGIVVSLNGGQSSGLGAENKIYDPLVSNACYGIAWLSEQNYINSIFGGSISAEYGIFMNTSSQGVIIQGGNYSVEDSQEPANSFVLRNVNATVRNNLFVVSATVTSPDAYLVNTCKSAASCLSNVYNSWNFATVHYGIVPFQLSSYNASTHEATWTNLLSWSGPFRNTCCGDLAAELKGMTKVYAAEMVTTFWGSGITATGVHVENASRSSGIVPTELINSSYGYGANRPNRLDDTFLDYDPSGYNSLGASPNDTYLAAFYAQQEFPFIDVNDVDLTIDTVGVAGDSVGDYLMVQMGKANLTWRGGALPINIRTHSDSNNNTFSAAYSSTTSSGLGGGWFERSPFVSAANTAADIDRTAGWESTPFWGYRPVPWALPCISPSQYKALHALPSITHSGSPPAYSVSYPLIYGGQQYRLCDWNLGTQSHYGFIATHYGWSYGQDLTTSNVPSLSWSSRGGSPALYVSDSSGKALPLAFPGWSLTLAGTGGSGCPKTTENFTVMEVHRYSAYLWLMNAGQDGPPYLPGWGTGNECTGTTVGQPPYSFTDLN